MATNFCPNCGGFIVHDGKVAYAYLVEVRESYPGTLWACSACGEEYAVGDIDGCEAPEVLGLRFCVNCGRHLHGFRPLVEDDE